MYWILNLFNNFLEKYFKNTYKRLISKNRIKYLFIKKMDVWSCLSEDEVFYLHDLDEDTLLYT